MKLNKAITIINSRFSDPATIDANTILLESEYIDIVDSINKIIKNGASRPILLFLHAGARRFNRWFTPTPFATPSHYPQIYRRFVEALHIAAAPNVENVSSFLVHLIRDDFFDAYSIGIHKTPYEHALPFKHFKDRLESLRSPSSASKISEFQTESTKLLQIMTGLQAKELWSTVKTSLPYPIVKQKYRISLIAYGCPTEITLTPHFSQPSGVLAHTAPPVVQFAKEPTRWQFGRTDVEIKINGLLDPNISTSGLQLPDLESSLNDNQPSYFVDTFLLLDRIYWSIKNEETYIGAWVPSPSDLQTLTFEISTATSPRLVWQIASAPSTAYGGFIPSASELRLELSPLASNELRWSDRCKALSDQYAKAGESREALFWINVGVEALLDERFAKIAKSLTVSSSTRVKDEQANWAEARRIVAEHNPTLADSLDWPKIGAHQSRYSQIKMFCHSLGLKHPPRDYTSHYSKVSAKRNALFHGRDAERIKIQDLRNAIDGYNWLDREL
jgi:hypothetical protein